MAKSRAALKRANTSHSVRVFPFKLLEVILEEPWERREKHKRP